MNAGRLVLPGLDPATPWPWPATAATPGLMACPWPVAMGAAIMVQELYQLAYERARAAARPSRYELALHPSPN